MKLLQFTSMKSFAATQASAGGATLRDEPNQSGEAILQKLFVYQKYQKVSHGQLRSLVHMLGGMLLVLMLLSACSMLGMSSTSKKQAPAPLPKILGSGTLVNNTVLFDARPMGTPPVGFGMHMVTTQVGWGMRPMDGNEGVGGIIYRTTDGGKNWQLLYRPEEMLSLPFQFWVFDETMALLVPVDIGGYPHPLQFFYRTDDGGKSWQRYDLPRTPVMKGSSATYKWTFLDHNQGWVTAAPNMIGGCGGGQPTPMNPVAYEVLFHTANGGKTWQQVSQLPFKYDINGISFIDSHTGWLAAEIDDPQHPFPDLHDYPSTLFVTHDGGVSWQQEKLTLPGQESNQPYMIQPMFTTAQDGSLLVTFHDGQNLDIVHYYQYTLQDRGKTWKVNGTLLPSVAYTGDSDTYTIVDGSHLLESGVHLDKAPNTPYAALYALNKGQWVKTAVKNPFENAIVQFLAPQQAVALANESELAMGMYRSGDGGKTWARVGDVPLGV